MLESLLGLRIEVDRLRFVPCLPPEWKEFIVHYRYREHYFISKSCRLRERARKFEYN